MDCWYVINMDSWYECEAWVSFHHGAQRHDVSEGGSLLPDELSCWGVAETYNVIVDDDWAAAKEEETDNNDIGNDDDDDLKY